MSLEGLSEKRRGIDLRPDFDIINVNNLLLFYP